MGLFSRLFGKKDKDVRKRKDEPDVINVGNDNERMNWGIEKANLTLHYFEESLKSPSPKQHYFSIKVKIEDMGMTEHLWLGNPEFDDDGNLFGVVGNNPIDVTTVKLGQKIGINKKLVSDWMILEEGRLIGGYTIRAMRDGLSGDRLKDFDKNLGGMYIDEGEDHFRPDRSTPEGAILGIEGAYDKKDIDQAIAFKDFDREARQIHSKLGQEIPQDLLDQTAELLQLAFIQSLKETEIPSFEGVRRAFPKREVISDDHYIITEVCFYPDNTKSVQRLNVYRSNDEWKVGTPLD